ncbi:MAG: HEAT repeat domain-containing protein [Planctomycetia bacterium]
MRRVLAVVCLVILLGSAPPSLLAQQAAEPPSRDVLDSVVELIRSGDADLLPVALEKVRGGLKGEDFTRELAEIVLPGLERSQDRAALIAALSDRGDKAALPAIMAMAQGPAEAFVRAAAIRGVAALGGSDEVPFLESLLFDEAGTVDAARGALVAIRSDIVSPRLVIALGDKARSGPQRMAIVGILSERRETAALPALVAAAVDADADVRAAAMKALGAMGGAEQIPGMVAGLLAARTDAERSEADRAIVQVCKEHRSKDLAAAALLDRFRAADRAAREVLLPTLARVGGPAVLEIVDGLIASPDAEDRKLGLAALARWPDATVKDRLLHLVAQASTAEEREMLLGGLIRIAPLPNNSLDSAEKLALVEQTMALCRRDQDRGRLLERASAIRTVETLRFVLPYVNQPALAESACLSIVELAHQRKLRDGNKDEFMVALDKVLATTKNEEIADRAQRYKLGKTWERKKQ